MRYQAIVHHLYGLLQRSLFHARQQAPLNRVFPFPAAQPPKYVWPIPVIGRLSVYGPGRDAVVARFHAGYPTRSPLVLEPARLLGAAQTRYGYSYASGRLAAAHGGKQFSILWNAPIYLGTHPQVYPRLRRAEEREDIPLPIHDSNQARLACQQRGAASMMSCSPSTQRWVFGRCGPFSAL